MQIALNDWIRFKDRLAKICQTAGDKMTDFIVAGGGYDAIPAEEVIAYATGLAQKYGEASGTLAALMYDAIAELSNAIVPPAEIAELPTYGDVAKAVQGAAKTSIEEKYLGGVVYRLVKQVSADTTLNNARRDGAEVAWVPHGDTCAFCITLASRGWQPASKAQLNSDGKAAHIHGNCDCTYGVRFNSDTQIKGYDPDKYLKMYEDADPSGNSKDKINAMRREFYAENSEEINAQKRSTYEKRKERESSSAEELNI